MPRSSGSASGSGSGGRSSRATRGPAAVAAARGGARAGRGGDRGPPPRAMRSTTLESVRAQVAHAGDGGRLALRHALAHGWALHHLGQLPGGGGGARPRPRILAEAGGDLDRAVALYRLGVVRFKMGSHATAVAALDEALRCADGGGRAVRCAAGADPEHARQDPPPPEGLHRGIRGRDGGARARARARRRPGARRDVPRRIAGRRAAARVRAGPRLRRALEGALRARRPTTSTSAGC